MKKIQRLLFFCVFLLIFCTSAQAVIRVEGVYTGFPKESGLGLGVSFGFIPLVDTTLIISQLGETKIQVPAFSYEGNSFAGGKVAFQTLAIELDAKAAIPMTAFSVGGKLLGDLVTGEDDSGDMIALPGSFYAGVYGEYRQSIVPIFFDYFVQLGYLFKIVDGEEALNDEIDPAEVSLSKIDKSGFHYRLGMSLGF